MIERVFLFCFGSQRHKYAVLFFAALIAGTATVAVRGLSAGPASAPVIAALTLLLAIPISALFHAVARESTDHRLMHGVAAYALKRALLGAEAADSLLGDIEEYYAEVQERFGRGRAYTWYVYQIITSLLHLSGREAWRFVRVAAVCAIISLVYTFDRPRDIEGFFHVFDHLFLSTMVLIQLAALFMSTGHHVSDEFERFREAKRNRASSAEGSTPPL